MYTVYLISSEIDGNIYYKIGYTRRPIEKRIKEFRTGNASFFSVVDQFHSKWGTKIEAHCHLYFKSKKISGEWFQLNQEDIKIFKERCKLIHDNLELISTQNTYYLNRCDF